MNINLRARLENMELRWIQKALKVSGNNKTRAAEMLGLSRTTFLEKLRSYGIPLNSPHSRAKKAG